MILEINVVMCLECSLDLIEIITKVQYDSIQPNKVRYAKPFLLSPLT